MLSISELNEIELIKAQNEGLKKQNAELQRENAELKAYKDVNEDFKTAWEELKAENERLREDYINLCQQKDLDNVRWQKRCTDLHIEDKAKADKYWLVLQEIKTIAEEWMTDYCYLDSFYEKEGCCICHENKDCYSYRLLKALTKAEKE